MKNVVIIGAGDLGKEIVWLIEDINKVNPTYVILGFLDDDTKKTGKEFFGYKVLGTTAQLTELTRKQASCAVIAIQSGDIRRKIVEANAEFGNWETIIHPTAVIADSAVYGKGNIFFPQTAVSVDSKLGDFGLYYLHASVGNDCHIGDYVSVMLNASVSKHVEVDSLSYIGADKHIPAHMRVENKKIKKLVLIGAGGFGKEVAQMIESINRREKTYELIGFLDDGKQFNHDSLINGYPWLGNSSWILDHKDGIVCNCTIGDASTKASVQRRLMEQGVHFETIIAPTAGIASHCKIGAGCVFYWNVGISVNCTVGDGVLLNDGVKLGHDAVIGDYTSIMPGTGISGGCVIGNEVDIGGHAFVVPGKKVGDRARIAAGSVVFSNVKVGTTVLGNPAKRMRELE